MKQILVLTAALLMAYSASAEEAHNHFNVHTYGSFRKIISSGDLEGVVGVTAAVSGPHTYAVGEIKDAEGEITVLDGEVWLNYGEDGMGSVINEIPKGEQAMQLMTAKVETWREIVVPKNMSENELYLFVLEQAKKLGLNVRAPFPFLVEGDMTDLVWHVLQQADVKPEGREKKLFFTKLVEYRERAAAVLIGFCSDVQGGFTLPGELWHLHVIFKDEKTAGHIDAFSVSKGARLRLPTG